MEEILIAYATTEGQTRKIAQQLSRWIEARGYRAILVDTTEVDPALRVESFAASFLLGSLHQGKHQAALVHFVKDHLAALQHRPTAFFSVSLSAVTQDDKHQADANRCIGEFLVETGWSPTATLPVAGALLYTQYDWLKRTMMRMIASQEGGETDTSRDHEYTDWVALEAFLDQFLTANVATPVPA